MSATQAMSFLFFTNDGALGPAPAWAVVVISVS